MFINSGVMDLNQIISNAGEKSTWLIEESQENARIESGCQLFTGSAFFANEIVF